MEFLVIAPGMGFDHHAEGDIIDVREDGSPWGHAEMSDALFSIVHIPDAQIPEGFAAARQKYTESQHEDDPDAPNGGLHRARYSIGTRSMIERVGPLSLKGTRPLFDVTPTLPQLPVQRAPSQSRTRPTPFIGRVPPRVAGLPVGVGPQFRVGR